MRVQRWRAAGLVGILVSVGCLETDPEFAATAGSGGLPPDTTGSSGGATTTTSQGTGSGSATSATTTASSTGPTTGSDGSSTGPGMVQVSYPAVVAACTGPVSLDPMACEVTAGAGGFTVDMVNDELMMEPTTGYLRFEIDGQIAGGVVESVVLELTATDAMSANSTASGEIWTVEAFTLPDLSSAQPAVVGGAAVAPDQGAVVQGQTVAWDLPVGVVAADTPVFLAVVPTVNNGVDYWNTAGTVPPVLTVRTR